VAVGGVVLTGLALLAGGAFVVLAARRHLEFSNPDES